MGEASSPELRLICICGQRMRISPSMYGKPGRCVACKQKIRIPNEDEIPTDTKVISLEEHPEFLRKSRRPKEEKRSEQAEVVLGKDAAEFPEEGASPNIFPLDVLETLRALVSLEYRISHKLTVLQGSPSSSESSYDERQLNRYLKRIQSVREELNNQLRETLTETEAELKSVLERLSQLSLNAKAGEIEFSNYRDQAEKLRRRRDILERRRVNLRAWLAVKTPYEAGGYVRLPMDHEPDISGKIAFRHEPEEGSPLADWWVRSLRDALTQREFAERKIAEANRLEAQGFGDPVDLGHRRADAEGERDRAEANIAFCRDRLEQLERDYRADLQILADQLTVFRGRLSIGEVTKSQFNAFSREKARVSSELMNALELIRRALHSESPQSVPYEHREVGEGGPRRAPKTSVARDALFLWIGAGLLMIALFLPSLGTLSAVECVRDMRQVNPQIYWLVLLPLAGALAVFGGAFLSSNGIRGSIALVTCFFLTLGIAVYRQECMNSVGLIGEYFTQNGLWFLRPGFLVYVVALLTMFIGGCIALMKIRRGWVFLLAVVVALVGCSTVVSTDFFGFFRAKPMLTEPISVSGPDETGNSEVEIHLVNEGRRPLVLNPRAAGLRNAVEFAVERRVGADQWEDAGNPSRLIVGDQEVTVQGGRMSHVVIGSQMTGKFFYRLPPGEYRVVLGKDEIVTSFTIQEPVVPPSEPETTGKEETPSTETLPSEDISSPVTLEPAPEVPPALPEVELRGFLSSEGRPPQFRIVLYYPDGRVRTRLLPVLGEVEGSWYLAEFNRDEETVTLSNGYRYVVLRRGKREQLPAE